jgi:DNA invertase Pin-like site-specific DNA recombinase
MSGTTAQNLASQARKAREATARRDELIRSMRAEGATLRAIAEAAGLTHTAVAKILAR